MYSTLGLSGAPSRSLPQSPLGDVLSFVTPYWSGHAMMRIHLQSIRRFFPTAPILVSKKGGGYEEMEEYRTDFRIQYWIEECNYSDALLGLLGRCETEYVCILDHDTVLLADPTYLLVGLVDRRWDMVGIEERIRDHPAINGARLWPQNRGWMRLAPGYTDATLLMFNFREFMRRWGLRGLRPKKPFPTDYEFHYGICEKHTQHKYLLPFHTPRYGIGNVLKDDDIAVLWHQWFGAYRTRLEGPEADVLPGTRQLAGTIRQGEEVFLADYPNLDLSNLTPAWGPNYDIHAERREVRRALPPYPGLLEQLKTRLNRWRHYNIRKFVLHAIRWVERWWRML